MTEAVHEEVWKCNPKEFILFYFRSFFMIIEACGEFILPYLNANIIDKGAANGDIPYILRNGGYMILLALVMLCNHQNGIPALHSHAEPAGRYEQPEQRDDHNRAGHQFVWPRGI